MGEKQLARDEFADEVADEGVEDLDAEGKV